MKVNIGNWPSDRVLKKNPDAKRKVEIKIDKWDTWDLFTTLAHVILPALQAFRDGHQGGPLIADDDVQDNLKRANAPPVESAWDVDEFWFDRWNYILDEMIWSFDSIVNEEPNGWWRLEKAEQDALYERRTNGLRLFGKYFCHLWN